MKNVIPLAILILMLSCETKKEMNEQQKIIIENYVNAYNGFDINRMSQNLTETVIFENVSKGTVELRTEGLNEFKKQAKLAKQYFSQRKQTITSWKFYNPKVMIQIDYKAILAIDLSKELKAGDTLELKGQSEFEFKNGKIISIIDKS